MTTVLVTGANSGLGQATTNALVARGATVIATVRSPEKAEEVRAAHQGDQVVVELLDVTDAAGARDVIDRHRPDVVVNSAGDALLGPLMDLDDDDARNQFETLVIAPNRLARLAVRHQRARRSGRIVNVSSSLAEAPLPFTGWYSAAKAALDATDDVLRLELRPDGIDVVRVECGPARTPAWDHAADRVTGATDPSTEDARERWGRLTRLVEPTFAAPEAVAEVIAAAALDPHPRPVYRVGPGSRASALVALAPARVRDAINAVVFGLRRR